MEQRGLSADSQRSKVSAVKALFSYAHATGYLERNLLTVVATPAGKAKARDRIADEGSILAALHNPNLSGIERLFLNVLYYSGCRVSEAIALKWSDIVDGVLAVTGKGDKQREIRIPAKLQNLLDDARQSASADYIFATRTGKPVRRTQANRWIKSIGAKCGIPQLSCHWLRHCHASHSLERGADINLVSETLGHSSVAVTSKYLHSSPDKSSGDYLAS
jgi:integrase/recombinase XerD